MCFDGRQNTGLFIKYKQAKTPVKAVSVKPEPQGIQPQLPKAAGSSARFGLSAASPDAFTPVVEADAVETRPARRRR